MLADRTIRSWPGPADQHGRTGLGWRSFAAGVLGRLSR